MKNLKNLISVLILSALVLAGCSSNTSYSQPNYFSSDLPPSDSTSKQNIIGKNSEIHTESSSPSLEESVTSDKNSDANKKYDFQAKYFVSKLNKDDLDTFTTLYTAALNCKSEAVFKKNILSDTLDNLMLLLNYDCPELIHLKGDYAPIYTDKTQQLVSSVKLYYNMSIENYQKNLNILNKYFDSLKSDLSNRSEYECEKYIYDEIFKNCIYDEKTENSGSVYGALIEHKARCEGISKAFMWCMRKLGYECLTVVGIPNWTANSVYSTHSWNILKINGCWYHIDITADNVQNNAAENNPPIYGFFNTDDEFTYKTRTLIPYYASLELPECNSDKLNYHKMNDLIIQNGSDIENRLYKILDANFIQNEINTVSVKLESINDFNKALGMWEKWADKYITDHNFGQYSTAAYYNRTSSAIVIQFIPQ